MQRNGALQVLTRLESTSFHEAGHYVLARTVGFERVHAGMHPTGLSGSTFYRSPEVEDWRMEKLAVVMAGGIAERLATAVENAHTHDDAEIAEIIDSFPREEQMAARIEATDFVFQVLRDRWELVEAVAESLRQKGIFPNDN